MMVIRFVSVKGQDKTTTLVVIQLDHRENAFGAGINENSVAGSFKHREKLKRLKLT